MSRVFGQLKKKLIVLAVASLFGSCCFAAEVNLSEIEFSSVDNGYNIILKTDKKTSFKKTIQNNEKITIEMKNTVATEDFSTIYNEVSGINNITVTPSGKEDLKIQIQGADVDKSNISLDYKNTAFALEAQNFDQNQINLSLPIENYKPVYNENSMVEEEDTDTLDFESVIKKVDPVIVAHKVKNMINKTTGGTQNSYKWLTYLGLAVIMITAGKNILKPSKEAQIGLTQNLKEHERELAKKLNSGVKETLSLRNKIAQNASAPSINYGLRSYQNSQKNPYDSVTTPIRPTRKPSVVQPYTQTATKTPLRNKPATPAPIKAKTAVHTTPISPARTDNRSVSVDSMKFLESMTRIYEKNGRTDLAMGLKNNMKKVNF